LLPGEPGRDWGKLSGLWKQARSFLLHRVLHTDDTPHRIALGVAIATFIAFMPLLGVQTVLAVALAAALRANKAVCIPMVWITNPFTAAPIYWYCWRLGSHLLATNGSVEVQAGFEQMAASWAVESWSQLLNWAFWMDLFHLVLGLGSALWLGCGIVGLITGVVMYGLTVWGVSVYRRQRAARRMRRHVRRQESIFIRSRRKPTVGCRESV